MTARFDTDAPARVLLGAKRRAARRAAVRQPLVDLRAMYKDWPQPTPKEARACDEGKRTCCRCKAIEALGLDRYTLQRDPR